MQHSFAQSAVAPHDFAFTPNHYLFVENRVDGDILPYLLGKAEKEDEKEALHPIHMMSQSVNLSISAPLGKKR